MAWNKSPRVAAARDFGETFVCPVVIITYIGHDGRPGYASYGRNKRLCDYAKKLADAGYDAIVKHMEEIEP